MGKEIMGYKYVQGIKVQRLPEKGTIRYQAKEPPPYPKVSDGYEKLSSAIFNTQLNNMFMDLTKEMVKMKSK